MAFSWGSAVGKLFDWIPGRREARLSAIDKAKKELVNVQNTVPFDAYKYQRIVGQLRDLEEADRRST